MTTILSIIASAMLLVPKGGDPSVQPPETVLEGSAAVNMPSAFFGGEGVTGVTYTIWLKWDCRLMIGGGYTGISPMVNCMCSYEATRSSNGEGGEALPNLIGDYYLTHALPLSDTGTWSAQCLTPAVGLAPDTLPAWKYGCFSVNYTSDTAFTLNVGGAERYCEASDTNVVFSIIATSSDRTVSIAAESADAAISFGIAHNPLHQFVGGQSDNMTPYGSVVPEKGGVSSNEWRMVVFRARIDGTNLVTSTEMWRPYAKCTGVDEVTQPMWHPVTNFAENASVRVNIGYVLGMVYDDKKQVIHWYAPKGANAWMTDEQIELWRDMDYEEIQRRGM